MRLNISAWAIRNPVPSLVLFTILLVLGLVGFRALPITQFPNIDLPIVSVTVTEGNFPRLWTTGQLVEGADCVCV